MAVKNHVEDFCIPEISGLAWFNHQGDWVTRLVSLDPWQEKFMLRNVSWAAEWALNNFFYERPEKILGTYFTPVLAWLLVFQQQQQSSLLFSSKLG
jgi:hypothetical protein